MRLSLALPTIVALAVILALAVAAKPTRHVVLARSETKLPKHYSFTDVPHPSEQMRIWLALPQQNMDRVLAELAEVSDPLSIRYGEWLSVDEVQQMTASEPAVHAAVLAWVRKFVPAKSVRARGDSIDFVAPVAVVEQMFATRVRAAKHAITGRRALVAVGEWSVPAELADSIELITGLSDFPIPRKSAAYAMREAELAVTGSSNPYSPPSQYSSTSGLGKGFWPQFGRKVPLTLKALYNVSETLSAAGVTQAAVEFQGVDCYNWLDFQQFQVDIGMPFNNVTGVIGDSNFEPINCQSESNLDIEQILAFGRDATTYYFANQGWIYEWTQTYLSLPAAQSPMVASLSYGWMEDEQCQIDNTVCTQLGVNNTGYVIRSNAEMAKLGVAGKTLVICTQDEGAPSDNNVGLTDAAVPVTPIYPASSPYGLAVGATALLDAADPAQRSNVDYSSVPICTKIHCSQGTVESVAMSPVAAFTSGGGFSAISGRQTWQDTAVTGYLSSTGLRPDANKFSAGGRAYPDIAAVGEAIYYYAPGGSSSTTTGSSTTSSSGSTSSSFVDGSMPGGAVHAEGGTSASTPIIAGIVSLLNAHSLATTQKPLGFVTPLFYEIAAQFPEAFNQPAAGGNNTCTGWGRTTPCCQVARSAGAVEDVNAGRVCNYGYEVMSDLPWNPAVGLGTPNVGNLIDAMDKLAAQRAAKKLAAKRLTHA